MSDQPDRDLKAKWGRVLYFSARPKHEALFPGEGEVSEAFRAAANRMMASIEGDLSKAISGGASTAAFSVTANQPDANEPLTISMIEDLMASLPKRETWAASAVYPRGQVTICDAPDEKLYLLHPDDWPTIERAYNAELGAEQRFNPFYGLSCLHLDEDERDDADMADWRRRQRMRISRVLAGTLSAAVQLGQVFGKR